MSEFDQVTTDEFHYSLKFQVLTEESVMHLPDCTWGQQQDHIFHSMRRSLFDAPWMPVNLTGVVSIFSSFQRLCSFQLCGNSLDNFCAMRSSSRYKFLIRIHYSLLNGMFTNIAVTCENMSFTLP